MITTDQIFLLVAFIFLGVQLLQVVFFLLLQHLRLHHGSLLQHLRLFIVILISSKLLLKYVGRMSPICPPNNRSILANSYLNRTRVLRGLKDRLLHIQSWHSHGTWDIEIRALLNRLSLRVDLIKDRLFNRSRRAPLSKTWKSSFRGGGESSTCRILSSRATNYLISSYLAEASCSERKASGCYRACNYCCCCS